MKETVDPGLGRIHSSNGKLSIKNDKQEDITVCIPVDGEATERDYSFRIEMVNDYGMTLHFDEPDIIAGKHPIKLSAGAKISQIMLTVGTPPGEYDYDARTTTGVEVMGTERMTDPTESVAKPGRPRIIVAPVG